MQLFFQLFQFGSMLVVYVAFFGLYTYIAGGGVYAFIVTLLVSVPALKMIKFCHVLGARVNQKIDRGGPRSRHKLTPNWASVIAVGFFSLPIALTGLSWAFAALDHESAAQTIFSIRYVILIGAPLAFLALGFVPMIREEGIEMVKRFFADIPPSPPSGGTSGVKKQGGKKNGGNGNHLHLVYSSADAG